MFETKQGLKGLKIEEDQEGCSPDFIAWVLDDYDLFANQRSTAKVGDFYPVLRRNTKKQYDDGIELEEQVVEEYYEVWNVTQYIDSVKVVTITKTNKPRVLNNGVWVFPTKEQRNHWNEIPNDQKRVDIYIGRIPDW